MRDPFQLRPKPDSTALPSQPAGLASLWLDKNGCGSVRDSATGSSDRGGEVGRTDGEVRCRIFIQNLCTHDENYGHQEKKDCSLSDPLLRSVFLPIFFIHLHPLLHLFLLYFFILIGHFRSFCRRLLFLLRASSEKKQSSQTGEVFQETFHQCRPFVRKADVRKCYWPGLEMPTVGCLVTTADRFNRRCRCCSQARDSRFNPSFP